MRRYASKDTMSAFDSALVARVLSDLVSAGRAANTKARCISTLREFSKWAVRQGLLAKDATDDPKFAIKGQVSLPRPFEQHESAALMALELPEIQHVTRAVLYYSGMRVTPITQVLINDVTFQPPAIRSTGKGNKRHLVPMGPELTSILSEYLRKNPGKPYDRLLRTPKGQPLNARRVERWCVEWGTKAGVANCTPHRFRHTFATTLFTKGARMEVVQRLLGHANMQTTLVYAKVADQALTDAVALLSDKDAG